MFPREGNLCNPSNGRGIALLDVVSKIISLMITDRLQEV